MIMIIFSSAAVASIAYAGVCLEFKEISIWRELVIWIILFANALYLNISISGCILVVGLLIDTAKWTLIPFVARLIIAIAASIIIYTAQKTLIKATIYAIKKIANI